MLGSENVKIFLHNITLVDSYLSKMELGMLPLRCLRLRFVLSFFFFGFLLDEDVNAFLLLDKFGLN